MGTAPIWTGEAWSSYPPGIPAEAVPGRAGYTAVGFGSSRAEAMPVRHGVRGTEQWVILAGILVPSGSPEGPNRSHRAYIHRPLGDLPRHAVAGQRQHTAPLPPA